MVTAREGLSFTQIWKIPLSLKKEIDCRTILFKNLVRKSIFIIEEVILTTQQMHNKKNVIPT